MRAGFRGYRPYSFCGVSSGKYHDNLDAIDFIHFVVRLFSRLAPRSNVDRTAPAPALSSPEEVRNLAQRGERAAALGLIDQILASDAGNPEALFTRAFVLFEWRRYIEAFDWSTRALSAGCAHPEFLRLLGWCYLYVGNGAEAERWMRAATEARPGDAKSQFALGSVLQAMARWGDASRAFDAGLALEPDDRDALILAGGIQEELGNFAAAERYFRRAADVDPAHPSSWTNLGIALTRQQRQADGLEAFERANALDTEPQSPIDAFVNLAVNLDEGSETQRAIGIYRSRLGSTQSVAGFSNFGLTLLGAGALREGWHYNEFRWLQQPLLSMRAPYQRPAWDGQDLTGKTLLIRGEQGIGDVIQFLRYARFARAKAARVLLRLPPGLEGIAERIAGIDRVLATPGLEDFDFYVNAASLPRIFGTEQQSIPAAAAYVTADSARTEKWRARIGADHALSVAVVWTGSPTHIRDKERSIDFETFKELFDVPDVHFYSIQKGAASETAKPLGLRNVTILSDAISDFGDTAAIIGLVDLVVCVDTSVAHVAGAMGRPVWLLNARPGDWRWRGDADTTAWYPGMRIFRQTVKGDWRTVIQRVRGELGLVRADRTRLAPATCDIGRGEPQPLDPSAQAAGVTLLGAVSETRFGIVQYVPDASMASTSIRWYGDYLPKHLELLGAVIVPRATVLEVGSGVGMHALAMSAKLGAEGHLIAYEQDLRLRKILRQNLAANKTANVTLLPDDEASDRAMAADEHMARASFQAIDALRLESLALIKCSATIDADAVLRTSVDTLWRLRPVVFAHANDAASAIAVGRLLRDYGYSCWHFDVPAFEPDNFNCRVENVFGDARVHAVLALPEEIEHPIDLRGLDRIE